MGHAALIDGLLVTGKLKKGNQVVYVGSEVTRNIWAMSGFLPNYCGNFPDRYIETSIDTNYKSWSCLGIRNQLGDYKNAKIIGQMHFKAVGKQNPDISWVHTSPGAVGGTFATRAKFPVKQLMASAPQVFYYFGATHAPTGGPSTDIGVQR